MIKYTENPSFSTWDTLCKRPTPSLDDLEPMVLEVFDAVKQNGDEALKAYTKKFDGVALDSLLVSLREITDANNQISESLKKAIAIAQHNITAFHQAQEEKEVCVQTTEGVNCWQKSKPIEKVGLYIPGGTAPLFSTILMLAIPAKLAGCKEIVLCSPPDKEGKIHPAILYTANLCGIHTIVKVGGIQAIAAMSFGTTTVPQVYKLFGPGNQYVTVAKQIATRFGLAIDMPAGPSELLVLADETANPAFVASDLLSQAEHGADSQVVLVSTAKNCIEAVQKEVAAQVEALPRKDIAKKALAHARYVWFDALDIAMNFVNNYAPEHLILCTKDNHYCVENIANAGSVFVGNYSPESAGDYASGTNHTLPTNGFARQYSGVNLASFKKRISFQEISKEGLLRIGESIEVMAAAEGLEAHKNAVSIRLESLKTQR
ncbi:MAG: histidinol dehydrogenase [Flavobacteriaceae bacterium]|nr:histidinol dehydrogenase [Flavobacteriaceae bacterium]